MLVLCRWVARVKVIAVSVIRANRARPSRFLGRWQAMLPVASLPGPLCMRFRTEKLSPEWASPLVCLYMLWVVVDPVCLLRITFRPRTFRLGQMKVVCGVWISVALWEMSRLLTW